MASSTSSAAVPDLLALALELLATIEEDGLVFPADVMEAAAAFRCVVDEWIER